jgi:elongation factor Ts
MALITTEQIKELRDETGVSVMQCKKALEEAGGDKEKAIVILRKKSKEVADKKADRTLGAGVVSAYIHSNRTVGAMVELSCETDFVANNEEFQELAYAIAMHVAAMNPQFTTSEEVTEADKRAAQEVFTDEVKDKPAELREKILEGKMASYFNEKVLLEQPYIKNPEMTIGQMIKSATQKFGERIEVTHFTRYSL